MLLFEPREIKCVAAALALALRAVGMRMCARVCSGARRSAAAWHAEKKAGRYATRGARERASEIAYPRGAEARGAVLTGAARAVVEGLAVAAGPAVRAGALQENTSLFLSAAFPCVCPEPVLANWWRFFDVKMAQKTRFSYLIAADFDVLAGLDAYTDSAMEPRAPHSSTCVVRNGWRLVCRGCGCGCG